MSTTLTPVITSAGLNAVWNAQSTGLEATIAAIALGDGGWVPDNTATALHNEKRRIPVEGARVNPTQIHLTGVEDGSLEYWVREVGFYLADGTLLAIWSDADQALAYKSAGVDLLLAFDLVLSALPAESVTVDGTGGFRLPPATDAKRGLIRIATELEARDGTACDVAVTPAQLGTIAATRTAADADKLDGKAGSVYAPPGAIIAFAADTPPTGWLECNGSALSRTVYADLFAVIGTVFGAGDGATTFALPDLRGEFVRGFDHTRGVDRARNFGTAQIATQVPLDDDTLEVVGALSQQENDRSEYGYEKAQVKDICLQYIRAQGSGRNYGTPYIASIRPRNLALLYCIKY